MPFAPPHHTYGITAPYVSNGKPCDGVERTSSDCTKNAFVRTWRKGDRRKTGWRCKAHIRVHEQSGRAAQKV